MGPEEEAEIAAKSDGIHPPSSLPTAAHCTGQLLPESGWVEGITIMMQS
jgi:hypothetical protein